MVPRQPRVHRSLARLLPTVGRGPHARWSLGLSILTAQHKQHARQSLRRSILTTQREPHNTCILRRCNWHRTTWAAQHVYIEALRLARFLRPAARSSSSSPVEGPGIHARASEW